jgi:hypothetical protein
MEQQWRQREQQWGHREQQWRRLLNQCGEASCACKR